MERKEILKRFSEYLASEKGLAQNTITSYAAVITYLYDKTDYLQAGNLGSPVEQFATAMFDDEYSPTTARHHFMVLRVFARFLTVEAISKCPWIIEIDPPKVESYIPTVLSKKEALLLVDTYYEVEGCTESLLNTAILYLLYGGGLRVSELTMLKKNDVSATSVSIKGKGGKERIIPMAPSVYEYCTAYSTSFSHASEYYFLYKGKPLTRQYVWKMVHHAGVKHGLQRVYPHTLRHSFATHLVEGGADIRVVQELLGHASIATTQKYVHLSKMDLQDKFKKFHTR